MRKAACVWIAVAVVAAGCGGSPALPEAAAADLGGRVAAIRTAAASGNRPAAEAALAEFRRRVAELEQGGQVDGHRAAQILAAAAEVETQLALLPAPAPPPPAPPATVTAPPDEPRRHKGKGHKGEDD